MLKIKKDSSSIERTIVTAMIVSDDFLRDIQTIYNRDFFQGGFTERVAEWCLDYYEKYKKAPGNDIQKIYESEKRKKNIEDDDVGLISKFLQSISNEYERADKFNVEYVLDETQKYFKERSLFILAEGVQASLLDGRLGEAEDQFNEFAIVKRPVLDGIEPLTDRKFIKSLFDIQNDSLFQYPGKLGAMINSDLYRGALVCLMGPSKRGKTWWLLDMAMRAVLSRCNVAFFQAGDMTEKQQGMRICIHVAQRSNKHRYCKNVLRPVFDCLKNQLMDCKNKNRTNTCSETVATRNGEDDRKIERIPFEKVSFPYNPCVYCQENNPKDYIPCHWYKKVDDMEPLDWRDAIRANAKFNKRLGGHRLKLSSHSNNTLTVSMIKTILDTWEIVDSFIPDVIVVDYADIMIAENKRTDFRHQQNEKWKRLRGLSQERHCLLITATQSDAKSFKQKTLTMSNFSEDKRVLDHVTSMLGLNQTHDEKREQIMRINQLVVREDDYDSEYCVRVMQCLSMGRPHLGSY